MSSALQPLDTLRAQLASTSDPEALRELRAKADALATYYRGQTEEARELARLRLRIERRLGEVLAETVRRGSPKNSRGGSSSPLPEGITWNQSSRWQKLAAIDEAEFESYLASSTAPSLNGALKHAIAFAPTTVEEATCTGEDLEVLIQHGKRFRTIYADPPWAYGNQGTRASTNNHYRTMTVEEIAALPVEKLADEVAQLHLWTTNGFLPDAFRIIEAWGFNYKSVLLWVKPQIGIGNYWRVSHEFLLLGTRGGAMFPMELDPENAAKKRVPVERNSRNSWVVAPRSQHSSKPHVFREMVEDVGQAPRLEMFGRQAQHGWVVWGNEIERGLFHQHVEELSA